MKDNKVDFFLLAAHFVQWSCDSITYKYFFPLFNPKFFHANSNLLRYFRNYDELKLFRELPFLCINVLTASPVQFHDA